MNYSDKSRHRREVLITLSTISASGIAGCSGLKNRVSKETHNTSTTKQETNGSISTVELRERNEALRQEIDTLETNLSIKQETINRLEERVKEEKIRVAELEAKSTETNTTELQEKLNAREERIAELEATVEQLKSDSFSDETIQQAQIVGDNLKPSVVYLYKELDRGSVSGTGWFIDSDTIVSNGHVVVNQASGGEMFETMTAFLPDGTSFSVEPLAETHDMVNDVHVDMAVLASERSGTPVEMGDENTLSVDQPLVQNGHPSKVGEWVTSLGRFLGFEYFRGLTSSIPTRGGNSGSPVATLDGKVVGLTASTFSEGPDTGGKDNPSPSSETVYTKQGYSNTLETVTASTPISTVKQFVADNS